MLALGSFSISDAATRDEIAAINVSKSGNFQYWEKDSAVTKQLKDYVKDVTNKKSKNFIPVEDRIAVFDMDGTFLCETAPNYFDHMLFLHRAVYDPTYNASADDRNLALEFEKSIRQKGYEVQLGSTAPHQASVFEGMTFKEFETYVKNFMRTPVEGLTNLKWGEALYLPMVEVIKYLQSNDFKVYVVSGTDREITKIMACDVLNLPRNQVIGTDIKIYAKNQGDVDGLKYKYTKDDYLIRGEFVIKDLQMNKVSAIYREIGKQPVLAFGNSSGDLSMLNYTINSNKYKSAAFFVICDDTDREFGKPARAESDRELAKTNGWTPISMRHDWTTIYGDNVKIRK
ncbi:MAG: haloacid dehalogenase-like hydrolase [Selenomonadaceae bacterium]|nr:haloacid dehalogenase-like hydrolase [Selenomonadaceae bacterium]